MIRGIRMVFACGVAFAACGKVTMPDLTAQGGFAASGGGGQASDGGDSGGGAGGSPDVGEPIDDPCEEVEAAHTGTIPEYTCCEVGCAVAVLDGGLLCVDPSRHCFYDVGSGNTWEVPCPVGYECIVGAGSSEPDPCALGEFGTLGAHGFCHWVGEDGTP